MTPRDFWDELHRLAAAGSPSVTPTTMDEAERCHKLATSSKALLVQGTGAGGVASQSLATCRSRRRTLPRSRALRSLPGVDQVGFGTVLHVTGADAARLDAALARSSRAGAALDRIEPGLETYSSS